MKFFDKDRYSLGEAAKLLKVHISTLHRWRQSGVRGRRLACIRIGGRWYVFADALDDFLDFAPKPIRADQDRQLKAQARLDGFGMSRSAKSQSQINSNKQNQN